MARSASGESVLTRMVRIFEAFTPDETVLSGESGALRRSRPPFVSLNENRLADGPYQGA